MAFKEPRWGFWVPVKDKESAEYASKMSGLPVFILGLNFLFSGLYLLIKKIEILYATGVTLSGIFFLISALQIKKYKFKTLPMSVTLWLVITTVATLFMGINASTIINILIGLLAISGLRGWWWLTRNPVLEPEDFS